MELKSYQKQTLNDLRLFCDFVNQEKDIIKGYNSFWNSKNVRAGFNVPSYNNLIKGAPHVCFKVPTGGGKTFIACSSLKTIFNSLPANKSKLVVWLVPSDTILEQTTRTLKDINHPYRQKIESDFNGRVEIYSKQEALNGQNFNPTSVNEQLSVLILSFDTFRSKTKENRKVYQENGNLNSFTQFFTQKDLLVKDVDESALVQVINQLSPVVIVDESHNAGSDLSIEMLENINPSFILDLTATPKKNSNIISYVDAAALKKDNMVKLPVIVYNRNDQKDVIIDSIDLRNQLEKQALENEKLTGKYIRPIVLFQAQSNTDENQETFDKIKNKLIIAGIPENQIAIKTSKINDIKNVDLLAKECEIRYIITINALKEGWDCPFAYILATLANRTSKVDVEQILGRILRLPYTSPNKEYELLNLSYVFTSSIDFRETLSNIVKGLNNSGFSKKDYRVASDIKSELISEKSTPQTLFDETESLNFDPQFIANELNNRKEAEGNNLQQIFNTALEHNATYNEEINNVPKTEYSPLPFEIRETVKMFKIKDEFKDDAEAIRIPQFYKKAPPSLFGDDEWILVSKESLVDGFSLKDADTNINFDAVNSQVYKIDTEVTEQGSEPKYVQLSNQQAESFKKYLKSIPDSVKMSACINNIVYSIDKQINGVKSGDIDSYVRRVVENMDKDRFAMLENNIYSYTQKIKNKIISLVEKHSEKNFEKLIELGTIVCRPGYKFANEISPTDYTSMITKSLYTAEQDNMNEFEYNILMRLTSCENIIWWHRNISRQEFMLNGFVNHYPDFIVKTSKGNIILIETKGRHLDNTDSEQKAKLGKIWQNNTDSKFKYFMVFEDNSQIISNAISYDDFLEIIKSL